MKRYFLIIITAVLASGVHAQPVRLGMPKDSIDILFPESDKQDDSENRHTYFDLLVSDVNWGGTNGRLRVKFDSTDHIKGFEWISEVKPSEARKFIGALKKRFGPTKETALPKKKDDMLFYEWPGSQRREASYMFGSEQYSEGQTSHDGPTPSPNDINANWK